MRQCFLEQGLVLFTLLKLCIVDNYELLFSIPSHQAEQHNQVSMIHMRVSVSLLRVSVSVRARIVIPPKPNPA